MTGMGPPDSDLISPSSSKGGASGCTAEISEFDRVGSRVLGNVVTSAWIVAVDVEDSVAAEALVRLGLSIEVIRIASGIVLNIYSSAYETSIVN
jgi:hypothetical protein